MFRGVHEAVRHGRQPADIVEVQSGRRFVKDVERAVARTALEVGGEPEVLYLAARESDSGLAELDITGVDIVQDAQMAGDDPFGSRKT